MTNNLAKAAGPLLIGCCLTFSVGVSTTPGASAEELRIGVIAPMTGPFAQVGKDMVNGLQMYTDEVKDNLAGATVKVILEDDQAKPPTGVLMTSRPAAAASIAGRPKPSLSDVTRTAST